MLVESLIKATVDLQGFRVASVQGGTKGMIAELAVDRRYAPRCSRCGNPAKQRDTRGIRLFRHVPLWGIPIRLSYRVRRVDCRRCDGIYIERMPWASGKHRFTRELMVTLATWSRTLPWQQVAKMFGCAWGTVAAAVEEAVAYGLANRDLGELTHIGIDEISRKRGQVYVTNVYDLIAKRLVWSGAGRSKDTYENKIYENKIRLDFPITGDVSTVCFV